MSHALHRARAGIGSVEGLSLVAVSGGADSLALAIAASTLPQRFGAVIVDHGLQDGSDAVAAAAAAQCTALGLDPVIVRRVETSADEASARSARYAAFEQAVKDTGAQRVLLAHTLNDQAEQVLLGLLRGSGTRSLAGMPAVRGCYQRPLLGLTREDTEQICRRAGLEYWEDPSNQDTAYRRNLIRHQVLPQLREQLGEQLPQALARTARLAAADADALDDWAQREYQNHGTNLRALRKMPVAIASRVLRLAAVDAGAKNVGLERTEALCKLAGIGAEISKSAGPVQLDGKISAYRKAPVIVFTATSSTSTA